MGFQIGTKYTLTGPDGTTVSFNDKTDPNFIGWLTDITGLDGPEWRDSGEDNTEADGGRNFDTYSSRRPIVLEGFLDPSGATLNTRIERFQHARAAKRADAFLTWTETDGIERLLLLRLQSFRITPGIPKTFSLGMISASNLIYSNALASVSSAGLSVVANNLGNSEAFPALILVGAATSAISFTIGGVLVARVAYALPGGRTMTLNLSQRTCVDDLGANLYKYVDGTVTTWAGLAPGNNTVVSDKGTNLTVAWRHSWE